MSNLTKILEVCIANEKEITVLPFDVVDTARQTVKRPATVELYIPDDAIKNYRGNPKLKDFYAVIRIPRELVEEINFE